MDETELIKSKPDTVNDEIANTAPKQKRKPRSAPAKLFEAGPPITEEQMRSVSDTATPIRKVADPVRDMLGLDAFVEFCRGKALQHLVNATGKRRVAELKEAQLNIQKALDAAEGR